MFIAGKQKIIEMRLKPSLRKKNRCLTVVSGGCASNMKEIAPQGQSQRPNWLFGLVFVCFLVGLTRLVGLPPNFTPIIAGAIFLPTISKGVRYAFLPVIVLFLTDLLLGFHSTMIYTYGSLLLIGALAHLLRISLGLKAILGVLIWHLIVNFGVYLNSIPARPLLEVYVSAWPFDFRLLVSTLLFTCLFWLTERMISKRFGSVEVKASL